MVANGLIPVDMQKHLNDERFDCNDAIQLTKSGRKRKGKQTPQCGRMLLKEGHRGKKRPRWPPPTNQDLPLLLRWQNWYYLFMQTTCRQCLEVLLLSFSCLQSNLSPRNTLGQTMEWMKACAAIAATRFARKPTIVWSVDDIHFFCPIKVGDRVVIRAQVRVRKSDWRETHYFIRLIGVLLIAWKLEFDWIKWLLGVMWCMGCLVRFLVIYVLIYCLVLTGLQYKRSIHDIRYDG